MVATPTLRDELTAHGFRNVSPWTRGVDTEQFNPALEPIYEELGGKDWPRPFFLNVGRVAVEKNIEAFLALDLPGSKVVVGDGPQRAALAEAFPDTRFLGVLEGEALAQAYSSADVFVFPSRTDTFGIVILEALASGVPVAAYPVTGPVDILTGTGAGRLDEDLRAAALGALDCSREAARETAMRYGWSEATRAFVQNVGNVVSGADPKAAA